MNLDEASREFQRLSILIDEGVEEMRTNAHALGAAENAYRKARSQMWLTCPNDPKGTKTADREWTASRREAWIDAQTADLRLARDIADGMARAAYQSVRARQTQLSSLQTLLNAFQQEQRFAQTGGTP